MRKSTTAPLVAVVVALMISTTRTSWRANAAHWEPEPNTSWQWQLQGTVDTSFDVVMYDIDLFDSSQELIDQLHDAGRIVICYLSAGSYEEWRPDAAQFPAAALGNPLDGWPGERWLDIRNDEVCFCFLAWTFVLLKFLELLNALLAPFGLS
jgi:hypothetical protein